MSLRDALLLVAMLVLLSAPEFSFAGPAPRASEQMRAASLQCLRAEEQRRGLPFGLLQAIAQAESGMNAFAINRSNTNGSYDIGLMQINSIHLHRLRAKGIEREHLWNPCVNAAVGAFILQEFIARHGMTWKALAAYNTGSPRARPTAAQRYVARVSHYWNAILQQHQQQGAPH